MVIFYVKDLKEKRKTYPHSIPIISLTASQGSI